MNEWDEDDGESWKGDDACDHEWYEAMDDDVQLDMFAGLAMQAMIQRSGPTDNVAAKSYDIAEAMMQERERRRAKAEEDQP